MLEKFLESYKPLIAIPVAITIISVLLLAFNGLDEGVDLKGGSLAVVNLEKQISQSDLDLMLQNGLNTTDITTLSINNQQATVEIGTDADVVKVSEVLEGTGTIISYQSVGPVLSKQSLDQVYWAIGFAFLFMSISVFIIFRTPVPSMAVIFAAAADILIALGGMSLFKIPLSLASVGAILMLIGYSVDTDILLTTRLLKRKEGTITDRALDAMKTGITMSAGAIAAMVSLYLVTVFLIPQAVTLSQIAAVLIIGLMADIIATWLMNLGILRWYLEVKS
ncbi:protein translocase subunit SecF [Methanobacterium alcaliphilum]|uniref:protein translocase subunit SecF n=1 Tax=Methanobacterium alcaliphilum TaxID=392018 RepID=UPI00200A6470|nr:protein translocase subunit SecF [Methanobacterium alcaliphilum]MCK9150913.1 protein translocase subunit SecF [Methanobacterium alcaliphilum]